MDQDFPQLRAVENWLADYKRSWESQDASLVASLFTPGAEYVVNPFEQRLAGRKEIEQYWRQGASSSQKDIKFKSEVWSVYERTAVVHWEAGFSRTESNEQIQMDGVFRLVFVVTDNEKLTCSTLEEWWFSAPAADQEVSTAVVPDSAIRYSLKTKIITPLFQESINYYKLAFGMEIVEQWDKPGDRGAILALSGGGEDALLEIYYGKNANDFAGLSLQFRVDSLDKFVDRLPAAIEREGPKLRPWSATYLYLRDPNGVMVIVYEGGL